MVLEAKLQSGSGDEHRSSAGLVEYKVTLQDGMYELQRS
jgi:hypothetical protein